MPPGAQVAFHGTPLQSRCETVDSTQVIGLHISHRKIDRPISVARIKVRILKVCCGLWPTTNFPTFVCKAVGQQPAINQGSDSIRAAPGPFADPVSPFVLRLTPCSPRLFSLPAQQPNTIENCIFLKQKVLYGKILTLSSGVQHC